MLLFSSGRRTHDAVRPLAQASGRGGPLRSGPTRECLRRRRRSGPRAAFGTLLALALQALVLASSPVLAAAQTAAEPPVPPEALSSPRATIRTFLESFKRPEAAEGPAALEVAAACLDLSRIPAGFRRDRGLELAAQLKEVIDRIEYVRYGSVPDRTEGEPWTFYQSPDGVIAIARAEDGRWLFTSETVGSIPSLLSELGDRPRVAGAAAAARVVTLGAWIREQVPAPLRQRVFLLEHWQWIGLAALLLLGYLVGRGAKIALAGTVGRVLRRRFDTWSPRVERRIMRPIGLFVMAIAWLSGLRLLSLPPDQLGFLGVTMRLLVAGSIVWFFYHAVDLLAVYIARRSEGADSRVDNLLVPFVTAILQIIVVIIGVVVVLENFGVQVTGLLAGLGLGGIAIALAAQDTLSNFFGSLAVLTERPFRAGDLIKIGEIEGTVEEVGLRSTRVRTAGDSMVTVPNSTLAKASVDNMGARRYRRWLTTLSVTYDTPPAKVEAFCRGVRELVEGREHMRQDSIQVSLYEFGASSLDIRFGVYFEAPDIDSELDARHRLALDILRLAEELGVEFAFPTQTVHLGTVSSLAPLEEADP